MVIRIKLKQIWTAISVCSLGVYSACDSGNLPGEKTLAGIDLRFTTVISDTPTNKASGEPDIIQGTAFPDGTHTFGMFITYDSGQELVAGSNDNMKSTLVRNAGQDAWTYTDKSDQSLVPIAQQGQSVNITGYYPWTDGATSTAVPFDLSGNKETWKDLLYLSAPIGAQQVLDESPIALTFSHAYCWVTVNLSKQTTKNDVKVKSVSIANSYSGLKNRIVNKGYINPRTGDVTGGATDGPLVISYDDPVGLPVTGEGSLQLNFLVPSFMRSDVQDTDVAILVATTDGNVLPFPLSRAYLNKRDNLSGFEKGKHNTYNIIYNNTEMILALSNWIEVPITAMGLGGGSMYEKVVTVEWTKNVGIQASPLGSADHHFHTYLGEVAEGNNGKYLTLEPPSADLSLFRGWQPFLVQDSIYPKLMVAVNLALGGGAVPWKDEETGALVAKQACAEFRDGGYKDWRLPRIGELFLIAGYNPPEELRAKRDGLWSATEHDEDHSYSTFNAEVGSFTIFPTISSKGENLYVRCVRDFNKPKPVL